MSGWKDFIRKQRQQPEAPAPVSAVTVDTYRTGEMPDMADLTRIAKKVYPRKYAEVTFPDAGDDLLLVARNDQGKAVGYATLSPRTREIADLAIDPDIGLRQTPVLVAAVMKQVLETGGEWKAEMRESTSYRMLQKWADRVGIDMQNHGNSYEMRSGLFSKEAMFDVTFSIPDPEVTRQALDRMVKASTPRHNMADTIKNARTTQPPEHGR